MSQVLQISDIRLLLDKLVAGSNFTISAATNASPAVATYPSGTLSVGDIVVISGTTGMTALNGLRKVATVPSPTTATFTDLVAGTAVNGNGTFGGTVLTSRIYSGVTPGDLADLFAALDKVSCALGPFQDNNRAAESSLQTIFGA